MRVLVVDDNALHLLILRKIFEKSAATVVIANNGKEALDELRKNPGFNVILTDIMMPEMDGLEFLSEVKSNSVTHGIPVIGFTAGDVDYYRQKTPIPFDTLVPKPIDFWELYNLAKAKATSALN
ncbi:response regulator [Algoriphagus sp.]|uniref:response regulator n=1 Tax=Algoriphagus sp. TaxID=1872435 RepID=UPI002605BDA7|nr:response regulator [Algoriphagus sp.]